MTSALSDTGWVALAAIARVLTAAGTLAMAVAVIVTAVVAKGTLRAAREDSRARTRPVIVCELRRELLSQGTVLLVVRNLGASVATGVKISFDPPPPVDFEGQPDLDMFKWIYQRYASPVTTWAPGRTVSNVIRAGHDDLAPLTVNVEYRGPDGSSHRDRYRLEPDHVLKEASSGPSKTDDLVKLEQQNLAALQALVRTIRAF